MSSLRNHLPTHNEDDGWCFPDNEEGILDAINQGANYLWANTILFASHPLQAASLFDQYKSEIRVFGQPPVLVEKFNDKEDLNSQLRARRRFILSQAWTRVLLADPKALHRQRWTFPIVGQANSRSRESWCQGLPFR